MIDQKVVKTITRTNTKRKLQVESVTHTDDITHGAMNFFWEALLFDDSDQPFRVEFDLENVHWWMCENFYLSEGTDYLTFEEGGVEIPIDLWLEDASYATQQSALRGTAMAMASADYFTARLNEDWFTLSCFEWGTLYNIAQGIDSFQDIRMVPQIGGDGHLEEAVADHLVNQLEIVQVHPMDEDQCIMSDEATTLLKLNELIWDGLEHIRFRYDLASTKTEKFNPHKSGGMAVTY